MKFKLLTTKDRKLELNTERINIYVSKWKPFTPIEVEIKRRVPRKSDPLRKYYFGLVLPTFMDYLGYEKDEKMLFHRQLKIVYFQIKPDKKGIYRNVPSVFSNESEIPVPEKKRFVDWVIRAAAKKGCYVPDPD